MSSEDVSTNDINPPVKKRGRPKKSDLAAKKQGGRGVRGRPKGDASIMNEYKARMLNSPKSAKVLEAIFSAALDDEHKHQSAAWKLIMDRIAPSAMFEKEVIQGAGRNAIQINISGVGTAEVSSSSSQESSDDFIEGEYTTDES